MFEQFGAWLADRWNDIWPIVVIPCYEEGVRLRLGKHVETLEGGRAYWKIPFVDDILTENILMTTISLPYQKAETKDRVELVVATVLKYRIDDITKYLLEVNEPEDVLMDMPAGIIREEIEKVDRKDVTGQDAEVKRRIRAEAKKSGIFIMEVTYTTRAQLNTMVLMHEGIDLG